MAVNKNEFAVHLAKKMNIKKKEALDIIENYSETLLDIFKTGQGVTITGFGSFYLDKRRDDIAFKFNPSQRLRKILGWTSTYTGKI